MYIYILYLCTHTHRPTAVAWWKSAKMSVDIGIIGTECGMIVFINLASGQQVGITYINGNISSLHVCHSEKNDDATLLITSKIQQQWRLLLEQCTSNFLRYHKGKERGGDINPSSTVYDNTESTVPNKSKLQELKQLSVEKLATLKQKLIETKSQTLKENLQGYGKWCTVCYACIGVVDILVA